MSEGNSPRMEELLQLVRRCFAQTLMLDESEVGNDADFFEDLGGDSLDSLDVAVRLEEECGVSLPEEAFSKCRCVRDAAKLILDVEQGTLAAPEKEKKEIRPITRFEDTP